MIYSIPFELHSAMSGVSSDRFKINDENRDQMKEWAYKMLKSMTDQDFGYDVDLWVGWLRKNISYVDFSKYYEEVLTDDFTQKVKAFNEHVREIGLPDAAIDLDDD